MKLTDQSRSAKVRDAVRNLSVLKAQLVVLRDDCVRSELALSTQALAHAVALETTLEAMLIDARAREFRGDDSA